MTTLPRRLLVANRGEIACRIIRTAKRLGIETVAVHSDADQHSRHVRLADRAERIGPAAARQSYLDIEAVIAAAKRSGADAVHPGYGFLSENAAFAEACEAAGLLFVGPPASAIRAMGSKSEAKRLLEDAAVPLTPGYHGERQDADTLLAEADRIGYPILIKASAGGGGKGIRRVDRPEDFISALASCQREASSSFGDPKVLIERYITKPRHIEIQVFADRHGNVMHLGERDCSIQRRHQKVLEEAPAPGMTVARRAAMGEAAVNAAKRVGYVGAGTIEFIVEPDGTFYFMEMNTRLQVEHPVTEMITGLDLVEWQLRVAAGETLPLSQHDVTLTGHAIEVRLYAEDPERGFLPSPGRLLRWQPPTTDDLRVDTGVESGDEISPHYDAMIAKLIVHGATRELALSKMAGALRETFIAGPRNNLQFLSRLIGSRSLLEGDLDTHLIEREHDHLLAQNERTHPQVWLAALATLLVAEFPKEHSPWTMPDGFRVVGQARRRLTLECREERCIALIDYHSGGWRIALDSPSSLTLELRACPAEDGRLALLIDGASHYADGHLHEATAYVLINGHQAAVRIVDPRESTSLREAPNGGLRSPMPGRVVAVHVKAGDRVKRGAPLLAIEAMKMEHVLTAPADGVIEQLHVSEGAQVAEAIALVDFKSD
jgi:3-methylcrotonyl-CoA carboxylase alpha subunit